MIEKDPQTFEEDKKFKKENIEDYLICSNDFGRSYCFNLEHKFLEIYHHTPYVDSYMLVNQEDLRKIYNEIKRLGWFENE